MKIVKNDVMKKKSACDSLSKMAKNDQKWSFFIFDLHFLQNQTL